MGIDTLDGYDKMAMHMQQQQAMMAAQQAYMAAMQQLSHASPPTSPGLAASTSGDGRSASPGSAMMMSSPMGMGGFPAYAGFNMNMGMPGMFSGAPYGPGMYAPGPQQYGYGGQPAPQHHQQQPSAEGGDTEQK